MIILLFIIALFHGLVFATAQEVTQFVSPEMGAFLDPYRGMFTILLYFSGVVAALISQWASRLMRIKNVFIVGLIANFVGMAFFLATYLFSAGSMTSVFFVIVGMLFLGLAISWVATVLATYVIIKFPKKMALGMILLYSCLDFGFMLSPSVFSLFTHVGGLSTYLVSCIVLMGLFIYLVQTRLVDPEIPAHLEPLRKGSFLWKELRHRLGLFIFAMVLYGILESTFSFFGQDHLQGVMARPLADQIIFVFWLTLSLGQIAIGVPSFWVSPGKVLYILPLFVLFALGLGLFQTDYSGFFLTFIIGGIGCSAIFPLLLAMMGIELRQADEQKHTVEILPYFESGVGYLVAAYTLGLGIVALITEMQGNMSEALFQIDFQTGFVCALVLLGLCVYLDLSQPLRKKP